MTYEEFNQLVDKHSLRPDDLLYNSNALTGEAGECANQVKKVEMAASRPDWVTQNENRLPDPKVFIGNLREELSDVLFYLVRVGKIANVSLEEMMQIQAEKLAAKSIKYKRTFLK